MGDPGTWQQEQISLAYLSAVATRAGAVSAQWNVDKDGVDVILKRRAILVEFQMKCTFAPIVTGDGDGYAFDLDIRTYDHLRERHRSAAGYLGLVIVPRDLDAWLKHGDEQLLMRCSGYYARIQDLPASRNGSTVRISLPKKQRIDQVGLDDIFDYAFNRLFGPTPQEGVQ